MARPQVADNSFPRVETWINYNHISDYCSAVSAPLIRSRPGHLPGPRCYQHKKYSRGGEALILWDMTQYLVTVCGQHGVIFETSDFS
jgi:hypothetical protein